MIILREVIILTKEWVRNRIFLLEILFLTHSLLVTSYWNRKIETEPKSNKSNWAKTKPNENQTYSPPASKVWLQVWCTLFVWWKQAIEILFACKLTKPKSTFVAKVFLQCWSHALMWVPNSLTKEDYGTKPL